MVLQNESLREDVNVNLAIEAMERLLLSWSTSRLMLLGRILIVKTFAISKMIYLMQTLKLSKGLKVVFKFLWNRNFNAARAPERLKRSIMFTPVEFHSFGMMDLNAPGETLDLRSYGRLLATKHPFMAQLREQLITNNFFNLLFNGQADSNVRRSLELINNAQLNMLTWESELLLRFVNFRKMIAAHKLWELITAAGKMSIQFLVISRRIPHTRVGQLTPREFQS